MLPHFEAVAIQRWQLLDHQRSLALECFEILDRLPVDGIRVGIRLSREIDFGARYMQKAERIACGQRMGFLSVDDVVWDRCHSSGRCGGGPQCAKRSDEGHRRKKL